MRNVEVRTKDSFLLAPAHDLRYFILDSARRGSPVVEPLPGTLANVGASQFVVSAWRCKQDSRELSHFALLRRILRVRL